jgi:hypothetical protein
VEGYSQQVWEGHAQGVSCLRGGKKEIRCYGCVQKGGLNLNDLKATICKNLKLDLEAVPGWHIRSATSSGSDIGLYWAQTVLEAASDKPILFYKPRPADPWLALMRLEDINPAYCLYDESVIVTFSTAIMILREDIYRCDSTKRGH